MAKFRIVVECSKMVNKGREWCNVLLPGQETTANYRHAKIVFYEAPVTGQSWTFWPTNEPVGKGLNLNYNFLHKKTSQFHEIEMRWTCWNVEWSASRWGLEKKLVQHNARGGDRTSQLWAKRIEEKAPPVLFYLLFSLNYCLVGSCELLLLLVQHQSRLKETASAWVSGYWPFRLYKSSRCGKVHVTRRPTLVALTSSRAVTFRFRIQIFLWFQIFLFFVN